MINGLKESLWKQFGASIDMLKNAITMWPEEKWNTEKKFFYNAYHCLVFLEYYLTIPWKENFSPSLPFVTADPDKVPAEAIDDMIPERVYSKTELLDYLQSSREKCRAVIAGLTEENLGDRWVEVDGNRNYLVLELLIYNMRHVQHHAAQLNLFLRQGTKGAPRWVSRAKDDL